MLAMMLLFWKGQPKRVFAFLVLKLVSTRMKGGWFFVKTGSAFEFKIRTRVACCLIRCLQKCGNFFSAQNQLFPAGNFTTFGNRYGNRLRQIL